MENSQILDTDSANSGGLTVSPVTAGFLREIARWTKFLSVLGFVGIGLIVLVAFFTGAIFSVLPSAAEMPFPPVFLTVIYLAVAALYFFPIYYLFKFSKNLSEALKQQNGSFLEGAFENLKSHYKFIGIMAVIMLSLYALLFLFGIAMGGFALFNQ